MIPNGCYYCEEREKKPGIMCFLTEMYNTNDELLLTKSGSESGHVSKSNFLIMSLNLTRNTRSQGTCSHQGNVTSKYR